MGLLNQWVALKFLKLVDFPSDVVTVFETRWPAPEALFLEHYVLHFQKTSPPRCALPLSGRANALTTMSRSHPAMLDQSWKTRTISEIVGELLKKDGEDIAER